MPFFVSVMLMLAGYYPNNSQISYNVFSDEANRIISYSRSAKQFCEQHKYNNTVFFLVDMKIHSGKKRFFAINMQNDSIVNSGLVAHGVCGIFFSATAGFSNAPGFGCSSLGKYKIGNKYKGRFGTAYKLYGLDSTNSNAFKRNVVLHSYYEVPDNEIYPAHVCNSQGCPMVSATFLKTLAHIIDTSKKPVLLWIVN
jgi:hypothetical protein